MLKTKMGQRKGKWVYRRTSEVGEDFVLGRIEWDLKSELTYY